MRHVLHLCVAVLLACSLARAAEPLEIVAVEGQPLAANVARVTETMRLLGAPLPGALEEQLNEAMRGRDAAAIQRLLDPHVLLAMHINPEARVKVTPGIGAAVLQQAAYTPVLIKVHNESTVTQPLHITSPQAGPPYAGVAKLSMERQEQQPLRENENPSGGAGADRFLALEMYRSPPMTPQLSGLEVEYAIALIYSSEAGKREATIGFDLREEDRRGEGNQDLGFRGETAVLFDIRPAVAVKLNIRDADGTPTTARLVFTDDRGHIHPPQPRRLAPDLFFQQQIYRHDGETVLLAPGEYNVTFSRGPEYRVISRRISVPQQASKGADVPPASLDLALQRWVNPSDHGFYSGDHHIHAAGCAHYQSPTQGVHPADMFRQVKGEGLNVGCVLTWGPCFDYQRNFFSAEIDRLSEPRTLLKYDLEISGFGSQALGHVCLLNLKDQTYPGTNGTTEGWPKWTTPVMRWAKAQGAVTGYAHSASGLHIHVDNAAKRLLEAHDGDGNGRLSAAEAADALLPERFETMDTDRNGQLTPPEVTASIDRAADQLPNHVIPEMNGVGAMEIAVTVAEGVCDFISAMDTARIQEWNTWYHILNCGFPLKVSGETDFPCMSGTRVGQGRVYVQLGAVDRVDFTDWCEGLRRGRSYVSDGYAHALQFTVNGETMGERVELASGGAVTVEALVAFAPEIPVGVAYGDPLPPDVQRRKAGDTVLLHGSKRDSLAPADERKVELIINGHPVASQHVPADGQPHKLRFTVPIERSSWVALRHFPQMHTNPVDVIVGGKPIRASRRSAEWCIGMTELLWQNRANRIPPEQRDEAEATFQRAIATYRRIAAEASE